MWKIDQNNNIISNLTKEEIATLADNIENIDISQEVSISASEAFMDSIEKLQNAGINITVITKLIRLKDPAFKKYFYAYYVTNKPELFTTDNYIKYDEFNKITDSEIFKKATTDSDGQYLKFGDIEETKYLKNTGFNLSGDGYSINFNTLPKTNSLCTTIQSTSMALNVNNLEIPSNIISLVTYNININNTALTIPSTVTTFNAGHNFIAPFLQTLNVNMTGGAFKVFFKYLLSLETLTLPAVTGFGGIKYSAVKYINLNGTVTTTDDACFIQNNYQLESINGSTCTFNSMSIVSNPKLTYINLDFSNKTVIQNMDNNPSLEDISNLNFNKITQIAENTFKDDIKLYNIPALPKVVSIGMQAFINTGSSSTHEPTFVLDCPELTSLGVQAFYKCKFLKEVILYENNPISGAFAYSSVQKVTFLKTNVTTASSMFQYCTSLSEIVGFENIVRINESTFAYTNINADIALPNTTYIGSLAFIGSKANITQVADTEDTYINNEAFDNTVQEKLFNSYTIFHQGISTTDYIGKTDEETIAYKVANRTLKLKVPKIGIQAFNYLSLQTIDIIYGENVTDVGSQAFTAIMFMGSQGGIIDLPNATLGYLDAFQYGCWIVRCAKVVNQNIFKSSIRYIEFTQSFTITAAQNVHSSGRLGIILPDDLIILEVTAAVFLAASPNVKFYVSSEDVKNNYIAQTNWEDMSSLFYLKTEIPAEYTNAMNYTRI